MVASVRRGLSLREVARLFHVALSTVQLWVARAGGRRLDRVDFSDRPHDAHTIARKTPATVEARVLQLREQLKQSALGEYGAVAIRDALAQERMQPLPCERTIPASSRFSLLHQGRGKMLDHLLVSRTLLAHYRGTEIHNELRHDESVAFGTDVKFPESDHAPMVTEFELPDS